MIINRMSSSAFLSSAQKQHLVLAFMTRISSNNPLLLAQMNRAELIIMLWFAVTQLYFGLCQHFFATIGMCHTESISLQSLELDELAIVSNSEASEQALKVLGE